MSAEMSSVFEIHDPVRALFPMKEYPVETELKLEDGEFTSLYIPVIPSNLYMGNPTNTKEKNKFLPKYMKSFVENNLRLGSVKRIDFVDRSIDNSDVPVKCAYIHFNYWFDNDLSRGFRDTLSKDGKVKTFGYQSGIEEAQETTRFFKILPQGQYASGYFMFKINYKPIDEADYEQNVHQLAAANKVLEQKLKEKDALLLAIKKQVEQGETSDNLSDLVSGIKSMLCGE